MKRELFMPAALLTLAAFTWSAPAQSQPPPGPALPGVTQGPQAGQDVKAAPSPSADMQEDIEILRRLLDNAFAETYGFNPRRPIQPLAVFRGTLTGSYKLEDGQSFRNIASEVTPHTEGVYLKDYGVVYTATLPPTGFDLMPGSQPADADKAPPDDWERIRKQIRGDKPDPENRIVAGHRPLSAVILRVLADNGKHFGRLADGERITVAVTFRGAANCGNCHQNPWKGDPILGDDPNVQSTTSSSDTRPSQRLPKTAYYRSVLEADSPAETPAWLTDVRNSILLGDLHMKQGKPHQAIEAYQIALGKMGNALSPSSSKGDQLAGLLVGVDACNKLADAYVRIGDSDSQAAEVLKKASELAKKAEELTGGAVPANQPSARAALPAKLIVTATKKQLDDVGSGKLTFEAFCKAAPVEYVTPAPAAEKK
jgi:hypothetical protein